MSSNDKQGGVATQIKEDKLNDKEKCAVDAKSEISPKKRPASELNNADGEVKHKHLKTDHKADEKENGSGEKYEDDDEDEDPVPEEYDEGEDGEGDDDGADEEDDDEEEEA